MTREELEQCVRLYLKRDSLPAGDAERDVIDDQLDVFWAKADDAQRAQLVQVMEQLQELLEPFTGKPQMSLQKAIVVYMTCQQARMHAVSEALASKAQRHAAKVMARHGIVCPVPEYGQTVTSHLEKLLEGEDIE